MKRARTLWWHGKMSWPDLRYSLFRSIGRASQYDELWARALFNTLWKKTFYEKKHLVFVRKIAKRMADDEQLRDAFDSMRRLNADKRKMMAWLRAQVAPPPPPKLAPAERRARAAAKREAHARKMLAKHERAWRRERLLVARWRRVVARYDRRARAA